MLFGKCELSADAWVVTKGTGNDTRDAKDRVATVQGQSNFDSGLRRSRLDAHGAGFTPKTYIEERATLVQPLSLPSMVPRRCSS